MASGRPLRFYEQINSGSNVNFMLDFECEKPVTKEVVSEAFELVKKRHPYFKMRINNGSTGLEFVPDPDRALDIDVYVETCQPNDWQSRLIKIATKSDNCLDYLVRLELYSFVSGRYQLYGCINHAGIDGPGLFQTVRDLITYMEAILSGNEEKPNVVPKQFLDVHANYADYSSFNMDDLKAEPVIAEIIDPLKPCDDSNNRNKNTTSQPFINSKFFQMDETTTKSLLAECKKHSVTIQSVLSTAVMLAHLNAKRNLNNDEIVGKFSNSCPCCMRPYVASLAHDDIVCGSAALIWLHDIKWTESFWTVAQQTKESIRQCLADKYGLKWWIKLANSIPTQPYSVMSSSMGVVSLNEKSSTQENLVRVNDLRFFGSAYKLNSAACSTMTHAFTFKGRFTLNVSFTYPVLSDAWADKFTGNLWRLFELIAHGKLEDHINLRELLNQMDKHENQAVA